MHVLIGFIAGIALAAIVALNIDHHRSQKHEQTRRTTLSAEQRAEEDFLDWGDQGIW